MTKLSSYYQLMNDTNDELEKKKISNYINFVQNSRWLLIIAIVMFIFITLKLW